MEMVRQVAPLSSAVLLLGETGTGKELIARAIHRWSPRRKKPIIKVNCGALPVNLMDSELFGHEKGAFTGTLQKKQVDLKRADGGTLFLYEIGELVPDTQIRLLRVLQEKELERVGGTETIRIDVRVIAATHRNLDQMVAHCMFREDLFFRLKVFPIVVPPLRDRKEDIPALVQHFIGKKAKEMGLSETPTVTDQSLSLLGGYHWPGNVRELENAVERALILCQGKSLSFEEFKVAEVPSSKLTVNDDTSLDRMLPLESVIDRHIRRALLSTKRKVGGKKGAAGILGLNPSTLRKKMKKLNIPFGRKASLNDI